tara:strand:- start:190 stop:1164 length:975 start_codon:yes stop_codon:yes gene_type:complete
MEIETIIYRANPNIKVSTLKQYKQTIARIQLEVITPVRLVDGDEKANDLLENYKWIEDFDNVIKTIEESSRSVNTKRTLYGYLKIFLKGLNQANFHTLEEYKAFDGQEAKYRKENKKEIEDNRKKTGVPTTNNQSENLITKEELMLVLRSLTDDIKKGDDKKLNMIYLLLNTHLRFPFRNELHNLIFVTKQSQQKDLSKNYLWRDSKTKKLFFIRNVYKTAGSQESGGQKIDELPAELAKMYRNYLKNTEIKAGEDIFTLSNSQEYSMLLTKFFNEKTGKNISSTLLFKIISKLSEEQNEVINLLRSLSKKRGTNVGALLQYYL